MTATYSQKFIVRYHEADRNGFLKLSGWFDLMQETAAAHAERLGFGYAVLHKLKLGWVLSRLRIEIARQCTAGEELTVNTYPSIMEKLFAHREFNIVDASGKEVARASSAWLLLNTEKLRPVRLDHLPCDMPDNSSLPVNFDLTDRPERPGELPEVFCTGINYMQEDVNLHLNNAEYALYAQETIMRLDHRFAGVLTAELGFFAAVHAPETFSLQGVASDGDFIVAGRRGELLCFTAAGRYLQN